MLSLPFPRGWGLLVFVLPTYRTRPKAKRRPLLACPPLNRDLLEDAKALLKDGHTTAAAMTARVEIERLLTTAVMRYKDFGPHWRGVAETSAWLRRRRVLRLRNHRGILLANDIGNRAAHGRTVTAEELCAMFNAINGLRDLVKRLNARAAQGGAA